jgi:hypothetical protein
MLLWHIERVGTKKNNMYRVVRWLIAVLLLFGCSLSGVAALRPSFMLDYSSWHSTDVVLVTATARGGEFEVIESWKGDLHSGDHVVIPELKPNANAIPVWLYPDDGYPHEGAISTEIPKQLAGSQLLLFLKRMPPIAQTEGRTQRTRPQWVPSNLFNDMKSSVVWIDGSRLYRFIQTMNPGPSTLQSWNMPEGKLRERVAQVVQVEQELTDVIRIKDGAERAATLKPYLRSDIQPARQFAEEELGNCGSDGVPVIRSILDDEAFAAESNAMVKALVRAGGTAEGSDLTARLGRDLEFWRTVGPQLHKGWWNDDPTPESPLRNRYGQTLELTRGLDGIQFPGALNTATALRDLWHSLPQLDDPTGLNQMSQECDKLIHGLQQRKK